MLVTYLLYRLGAYRLIIFIISVLFVAVSSLCLICLGRLLLIISKPPRRRTRPTVTSQSTHLLIVLGSGGHTAEMLNMLSSLPYFDADFTHRTYLVSAGDGFSALKAKEFEVSLNNDSTSYSIATVRRARKVHQSFYTTPLTTLLSLWDCLAVLRGTHSDLSRGNGQRYTSRPDLILTNGPGTGVCVVVASIILRFVTLGSDRGQMRTIFIESWARVKTLSLSGKILRPIVNRFLVQWPQLADAGGLKTLEYKGSLVT